MRFDEFQWKGSGGTMCLRVLSVAERFSQILDVFTKMDERQRNVVAIATINGHNLLRAITERLKYEESSDEECDQWNHEANKLTERVCIRGYLKRVVRIEDYVVTTIHNYTGRQFREHFRLTRRNLEQILAPKLIRKGESGRLTLDI